MHPCRLARADRNHDTQMKKACLTRRAEMMKDMDKKGDLPLSLLASMKQKGGTEPQKGSLPQTAAGSSRRACEPFLSFRMTIELPHKGLQRAVVAWC
jgi:hypothetical protein